MRATLTQERLKELLHYDESTGIFTRKIQTSNRTKIGSIAGTKQPVGYLVTSIDNKLYYNHRLAWLYVTGSFPLDKIDHIDGDKSNTTFTNLRETDNSKNMENQKTAHTSTQTGLLGAYKRKRDNKFYSRITVSGDDLFLGIFNSAIEAHQAYLSTKRRVHGFCTI